MATRVIGMTPSLKSQPAPVRLRAGRPSTGRFRAEGPPRVPLGAARPRQGALALQLPGPQLLVLRARQRREERDHVVDLAFRQRSG